MASSIAWRACFGSGDLTGSSARSRSCSAVASAVVMPTSVSAISWLRSVDVEVWNSVRPHTHAPLPKGRQTCAWKLVNSSARLIRLRTLFLG
jgi:hypothetical protein